jgi:hypothetical protein
MKRPILTPTAPSGARSSSTVPTPPSREIFDPDEIDTKHLLKALDRLKARREREKAETTGKP